MQRSIHFLSNCICDRYQERQGDSLSNTKIVVVHIKEIIYTVIFAALGILLIILLVVMFLNKDKGTDLSKAEQLYTPGVYTTALILNDNALNLEVTVDENHINSVQIVNIDESTTTMFPLIQPSLEVISNQLYDGVNIDNIVISKDSEFTQTILLNAIKVALDKATPATTQ